MGTFQGITSLVLLALAMLLGLIAVALNAPPAAVVYTLIVGGSFLVIGAVYCAKSPLPVAAVAAGHQAIESR